MFKQKLIDLGSLHMANAVTLATRVRADLLGAMAKHLSKPGKEEMYVSAYNSRPVLHIKSQDSFMMAMTFTEAVEKNGRDLRQDQMDEAYRRVGLKL